MKTLIPKSEARKVVLERKKNLSESETAQKTDLIVQRLLNTDDFIHAKTIHCYLPTRQNEVNTKKIINLAQSLGKQIYLPKFNKTTKAVRKALFTGWDNLIKNSEGYLEPAMGYEDDLSDIDLFFVPAMAVSIIGQRVGSGDGYYDSLLKNTFAIKYVPAFEFQIFENIETEQNEIRIDKIITERRIINTREINKFNFSN